MIERMRSLSIKWKLAFIMVAVASIVSVAQIVLFSLYDARTYLDLKRVRMRTLVDIVGSNCLPALRFKDRDDALEVLRSLRAEASIRSAYLFDANFGVLAEYLRPGETLSVPLVRSFPPGDRFEGDDYVIVRAVVEDNRQLGTLYLLSDLVELKRRRVQEFLLGGATAVACFLLSLILALRLQRIFTKPIASLAQTMEHVTKEKNYALRAPKVPPDELGLLNEGFNYMLSEIERRDRQLAAQMSLLERTNKELDQFVYVASHDLKAPLRGVDNLARMITTAVKDVLPPDKLQYLDLMHSRIRRMEHLFDDLLAYSRVGRAELNIEPVEVVSMTREIIELLGAPKTFEFVLPSGPLQIRSTRTPLEQVLRNLIGNALKHHDKPHGKITISAVEKEQLVEFSVCDDGPGIAPQYQEKIFEMFQTLRPRDDVEGSGMGLALVKKIVENQGGKVWLRSAEGRGACFFFTWMKR